MTAATMWEQWTSAAAGRPGSRPPAGPVHGLVRVPWTAQLWALDRPGFHPSTGRPILAAHADTRRDAIQLLSQHPGLDDDARIAIAGLARSGALLSCPSGQRRATCSRPRITGGWQVQRRCGDLGEAGWWSDDQHHATFDAALARLEFLAGGAARITCPDGTVTVNQQAIWHFGDNPGLRA